MKRPNTRRFFARIAGLARRKTIRRGTQKKRSRKEIEENLVQCVDNQTFLSLEMNAARRNGEIRKANMFEHLLKDEKRRGAELVLEELRRAGKKPRKF